MNKPLLSICIPTYNRAGYLGRCLESIRIQLAGNDFLDKSVEIVISDNCSPDNTSSVVENYKKYFHNIRYSVNEKNLGFDLNVLAAVKNATGKYCWYMGDDDIIVNGAIGFVSDHLKNDLYDVATMDMEYITDDENYKTKKIFSDKLIDDSVRDCTDFFLKGYCPGGFSLLVFNKELWMSLVDENDVLEYWLYFETVLKMTAATKKKMLRIKQALVLTGQDCRWTENGGDLFAFTTSNILLERMIGFGFDKKRILENLNKNRKRIILFLLRAKGHNLKCNMANLRHIYENSKGVGFLRLSLATAIYFIPNPLIKAVRDIKKFFVRLIK